MGSFRYGISLGVLNSIAQVSAANELEVETVLFLYTKVGIVPKSTLRKENTISKTISTSRTRAVLCVLECGRRHSFNFQTNS